MIMLSSHVLYILLNQTTYIKNNLKKFKGKFHFYIILLKKKNRRNVYSTYMLALNLKNLSSMIIN